jgi:muconate cycloisomerase
MSTSQDPIRKVELFTVFVPFKEYIRDMLQGGSGKVAMGLKVDDHWLGGDFLVCRMTTENGVVGIGDSYSWLVESAASPAMMAEVIRDHLARFVLGRSAFDMELINDKMDNNVARNEMAKGVLDLALYDVAARTINRPVHDLCGGKQIDRIPMSMVLPLTNVDTIRHLVGLGLEAGIKSFRCKLGDGAHKDVEIIKAVRELIGPEAGLRVDYNQAYNANEALAAIEAIAPYRIDYAEQPVKGDDFVGMAWVQSRTNVPLMAHESGFGLRDIVTLAEMGAVRTFGINPERPGGMTGALKAIDYAAAKGLDVVLHNQPSGIGSAVILHMHAARARNICHATELQGHIMMEDDLIKDEIVYEDGFAHLPEGPGWGVELDEDAIDKYQIQDTIVIEA